MMIDGINQLPAQTYFYQKDITHKIHVCYICIYIYMVTFTIFYHQYTPLMLAFFYHTYCHIHIVSMRVWVSITIPWILAQHGGPAMVAWPWWPPGLPMVPKAMRRMLAENHLRRLQMSPTVGVCFEPTWPMFFSGLRKVMVEGLGDFLGHSKQNHSSYVVFCKTAMVEMVKRGSPSDTFFVLCEDILQSAQVIQVLDNPLFLWYPLVN